MYSNAAMEKDEVEKNLPKGKVRSHRKIDKAIPPIAKSGAATETNQGAFLMQRKESS